MLAHTDNPTTTREGAVTGEEPLEPLRFLSLGWGVQSWTLAAMMALDELPRADYLVHAALGPTSPSGATSSGSSLEGELTREETSYTTISSAV